MLKFALSYFFPPTYKEVVKRDLDAATAALHRTHANREYAEHMTAMLNEQIARLTKTLETLP